MSSSHEERATGAKAGPPAMPDTRTLSVADAAAILRSGGLVAFPTETVYGLGADALNDDAVARVFEAKGRPRFDPLIVHLAEPDAALELAADWPALARDLAERFWPGPLTLVVDKRPIVPDLVTAGLDTVALRVPDHELARSLIATAGRPVAAPSANRFGGISPTTAQHVRDEFGGTIDGVVDGGACRTGVESTVLAVHGDRPRLLRPGGLTREQLEQAIGQRIDHADSSPRPTSPGMLARHYAPRTPLTLTEHPEQVEINGRYGLLSVGPPPFSANRFAAVEVLSEDGDVREAARHLFAAIRRLDAAELDRILAIPADPRGLGVAINDRLRRAQH